MELRAEEAKLHGDDPAEVEELEARQEALAVVADALQAELEAGIEACPSYVKRLVEGYELRVYWFEIYECVRKILLVGIPIFFPRGEVQQLGAPRHAVSPARAHAAVKP